MSLKLINAKNLTKSFDDFIACEGEAGAKKDGKLRLEGKEYTVQDGDVIHFKFNV